MQIKSRIRTIAHYPHEGIMFRDITTLLKDPVGLRATIQEIAKRHKEIRIDKVAGDRVARFHYGGARRLRAGGRLRAHPQKGKAAGRDPRA